MIKIEKTTPLVGHEKISLEDIAKSYYERVIKNTQIISRLEKARDQPVNFYSDYGIPEEDWSDDHIDFVNSLLLDNNLEKLFIEKPDQLENTFYNPWRNLMFQDGIGATTFSKAIKRIFNYTGFRDHKSKGKWLTSQLNIKTCPYCNANYTLTVNIDGVPKGLFQFDHFFPRSRAPHLSLSLYNLIPSCANCNHIKSDVETSLSTHFHPYHHDLSRKSFFNHEYTFEDGKKPSDIIPHNIKLEFISKSDEDQVFVDTHQDLYKLNAVYQQHKDVVKDLIVREHIHPDSIYDDLKALGIFEDNEGDLRRYLLGNYGLEEEINQRPLVKLQRDVAIKLGLIKD